LRPALLRRIINAQTDNRRPRESNMNMFLAHMTPEDGNRIASTILLVAIAVVVVVVLVVVAVLKLVKRWKL